MSHQTLVLEAPPRRREAVPRGVALAAGLLLSSALADRAAVASFEGWIIADKNWLLSPGSRPLGNSRIEVVDDSGHMALVRVCARVCRR